MDLQKETTKPISGPAWNIQSEYPSLTSAEFKADREKVEAALPELTRMVASLQPLMQRDLSTGEAAQLIHGLQEFSIFRDSIAVLESNLTTYTYLEISVNAKNHEALQIESELSAVITKIREQITPIYLYLARAPEAILHGYLQHPAIKPQEFYLRQERQVADTLLSEKEEMLLTSYRPYGPTAWGNLYSALSGTITCEVQYPERTEKLGLAQASALLREAHEPSRKAAWQGLQSAWKNFEEPAAGILNAIAGWRNETYQRRSHTREVDFLFTPLHLSRIKRETLHAMLSTVQDNIEISRKSLRLIAQGLGKPKLDPWDLMAPAPALGDSALRSFDEAIEIVAAAFHRIDPEFGDFLHLMKKNQWLEGRILSTKRTGAYCTRFAKSKTPRVFQTYMGTIGDIRTLAHEVGHAYHGWVMRDLPMIEHRYPMTLAETASIFAETAFGDYFATQGDAKTRFEIAWQEAETVASFCLNIPARFEFEKNFYELRLKRFVTANELSDLMENAWQKWYGDTLSHYDRYYWASKLHFSMSSTSFYNFPYTFGYLFSLGIYALRTEMGSGFMPKYRELLRDTGRMTAEDLVQKHLGEDITKSGFWQKSLNIVAQKVIKFEQALVR